MARYHTNEQTVNCSCGVTFSINEFVRVPSYEDAPLWDRYCPNCNGFWGAAPGPIDNCEYPLTNG